MTRRSAAPLQTVLFGFRLAGRVLAGLHAVVDKPLATTAAAGRALAAAAAERNLVLSVFPGSTGRGTPTGSGKPSPARP